MALGKGLGGINPSAAGALCKGLGGLNPLAASLVPPWCLTDCPISPFLPPWCLACPWLSRASGAVQIAFRCLLGYPNRSLEPPRQSKRLFCCLMGCPRRYLEPPKHSRWLSGASRAAQIALGETPCTGFRGPNPLAPTVSGAKTLDQAMKTTRFRGRKPCKPQSR